MSEQQMGVSMRALASILIPSAGQLYTHFSISSSRIQLARSFFVFGAKHSASGLACFLVEK